MQFSKRLLDWYHRHGRHDLPWQQEISAYRIWISEVMLQQTQVTTVIPYFDTFMQRFPDVVPLASAGIDEVLHYWTGLGYYARARNLHTAAKQIMELHGGTFPLEMDAVIRLPGIGRSTAGAILAIADKQRHPILDGNVKRVLSRYHGIREWPGKAEVTRTLWGLADQHTPGQQVQHYTQAIMDLGASVCTRKNPHCHTCPVAEQCYAREQGLQSSLPVPRPARSLPVRKTHLAIIENTQGRILLQQRPPSGIWGGLWSFPECNPGSNIEDWLQCNLGCTSSSINYKTPVRHTFTHFHLDITPVHIKINNAQPEIKDSIDCYWYAVTDTRKIGLAAPVKALLEKVTT